LSFFEGIRNSSFTATFLVWEKQFKQQTKKCVFNENDCFFNKLTQKRFMNFTPVLEAKRPDFNKNRKIEIGKIFFKYVIA